MLLWRAVFVHVGSAYRRTMIGGVFGVVKGGFSSGFAGRGIPAYAGMTEGVGIYPAWSRLPIGSFHAIMNPQ